MPLKHPTPYQLTVLSRRLFGRVNETKKGKKHSKIKRTRLRYL